MLSVDGLHKAITPSQLTRDLDGTMPYDHVKWIEICLVRLLTCYNNQYFNSSATIFKRVL